MNAIVPDLVSTVIPVRNRPAMLREAVASVLAQTYRPVEVVIVDDGSSDETWSVACALQAQHVEVRAERIPPSGIGAARNAGLKLIRGEFVQFLDSDDLLLPDKFAVQTGALRAAPEAGIAYCRVREYPFPGTWNGQPARLTAQAMSTLFPALLRDRIWCAPSPLYRRAVVDAIGDFQPVSIHEDWEYEVRAGALGVRLHHCDVYLADKRNVHAMEGRTKGGARRDQLADYAAMQLLILQHARAAGVTQGALRPVAARLFTVAQQCALGGAIGEAERCLRAACEVEPHPAARVWVFLAAGPIVGWRTAATANGYVVAAGERMVRLLAWPGRVVRYLQRRRRELPLIRRAHRILHAYTEHHKKAQRIYRATVPVPPPVVPMADVGVRVLNDDGVPGLSLPAGYRAGVDAVAARVDRAFEGGACEYFPALARSAAGSTVDGAEAVRRGDVISIKLVNPFALDGIADLINPLIGQLERLVYGSYAIVDKVYVYRSPVTRQQPAQSWLWHYDNHPREVLKLMVYLTDVEPGTAPFEFIRSRATGRPRPGEPLLPKVGDSRVAASVVDAWLADGHERVTVTGPAGTAILFDDNVVHRATLATAARRDVVVFQLRPAAFRPGAPIDPRWTGTFVNRDFNFDPWQLTPEPR